MKVRESQAPCCERIDVGGVDLRTEASQLGESGVIEQNDHDVWSLLARVIRLAEPGLRIRHSAADATLELCCPIGARSHSVRSPLAEPYLARPARWPQ
jgi:hypothetical protein